jgi:hypothetical protein
MKLSLSEILDGSYEPTSFAQMIIVSRIRELVDENERMLTTYQSNEVRVDELVTVLSDIPDEAALPETPNVES